MKPVTTDKPQEIFARTPFTKVLGMEREFPEMARPV